MKKTLLWSCLVASLGVSNAQSSYTAADGFDRPDNAAQTPASAPNLIGSQWTIATGTWAIHSGQLRQDGGSYSAEEFIYLNTVKTSNSVAGSSFSLQATIQLNTPVDYGSWAGMLFNYQDPLNFDVLRYCGAGYVQLLKYVGGNLAAAPINAVLFSHVQNRPYKLTVSSSAPDTFAIGIDDTVTATTLYTNASVSVGGPSLADGYAGFYVNANLGNAGYDNLSLTVTPAQFAPPSVVLQTVNTTGVAGDPLALSPVVDGNPAPLFQWKFNGSALPGATNPKLSLSSLQPAHAGSYSLYASNALGSVNTAAATVRVLAGGGADGFSRANTTVQGPFSSPNAIGANWTIANGSWALSGGRLVQAGGSGEQVIYRNSLQTLNSSASFALQANLQLNTSINEGTAFAGLVFNLQDAANYYVVRYCGSGYLQLLSVVGGGIAGVFINQPGIPFVPNRPYTFTVSSSSPHHFALGVYDTLTGSTLYTNASIIDGAGSFQDGYGGFYANTGASVMGYDNFGLTVTPAPAMAPTVLADPADSLGFPGSSVTLSAYIDGSPAPQLQWKFNGVNIPLATNQTLVLNHLHTANTGSYSLCGTNAAGGIQTAEATVALQLQGRDSFARPDTAPQTPSSIPNPLGWQWTIADGTWAVANGQLVQASGSLLGEQVIYWNTLQTLDSLPGTNFTVQATVQLNAPVTDASSFAGVVFNLQDAANYYVFRYCGNGYVQLISVVGGSIYGVFINQPGFTPVSNRPYTLSVTSAGAYTFSVSVFDTVSGSTVYSASASDGAESFQDGYGGLYASANVGVMAYKAFNLYVWPASYGANYNQLSSPLLSGGSAALQLPGTPGNSYVLEQALSLAAPVAWQPLATNFVELSGVASFTNSAAAPASFFRTRQP